MADRFLYERVYNYIVAEVRSQNLRAGDRVPSEQQLAEQFGVSRITTKRALQMLAEAGVLERRRGKGSFVAARIPRLEPLVEENETRSRGRDSPYLGFVFPDASDAYGARLLGAIEERSAEYGYHLVVRRTRDSQEVEEQVIDDLRTGVVGGMIVFPVHGEYYNASLVRLVFDREPLVLVDRHLHGIPACAVYTDNVAAARELTTHLLTQGHEHIAFCSPPTEHTSSIEERIAGYELALRDQGLPVDHGRYLTVVRSTLPAPGTAADAWSDRDTIREFVRREPAVTAFVACEYPIAIILRRVLDELGETQQTVVCFDSPDLPLGGYAFTHIRQDQHAMGVRAVDLLVSQLKGEQVPPRTVIPFSLVEPASEPG